MLITRFHSVLSANTHPLRELLIATNHQAGIAGGAEILRRIKTETTDIAHGSGLGGSVLKREIGADRLGCVFDQNQIMLVSDREHFAHITTQSKKMNGNKRDNSLSIFVNQFSFDAPAKLFDITSQGRRRN